MVKEDMTTTGNEIVVPQIAHPMELAGSARNYWLAWFAVRFIRNIALLTALGWVVTLESVTQIHPNLVVGAVVLFFALQWGIKRLMFNAWAEVPGAFGIFPSIAQAHTDLPGWAYTTVARFCLAATTAIGGALIASQSGTTPTTVIGNLGVFALAYQATALVGKALSNYAGLKDLANNVLLGLLAPVNWVLAGTPTQQSMATLVVVGATLALLPMVIRYAHRNLH